MAQQEQSVNLAGHDLQRPVPWLRADHALLVFIIVFGLVMRKLSGLAIKLTHSRHRQVTSGRPASHEAQQERFQLFQLSDSLLLILHT